MTSDDATRAEATLVHECWLYRSWQEYRTWVVGFVREGQQAGEPVLVAVPRSGLELVRAGLDGVAGVQLVDMAELGRNPGCIIPALHRFVNEGAGRPVRFVGEPIWPAREPDEALEAARHEALLNLAFADVAVSVACPYDARRLPADVLAGAERSHPVVVAGERRGHSARYAGPAVPAEWDGPLPAPPADAETFRYASAAELAHLRAVVGERARRVGLPPDRVEETVLAVDELASNTLLHTAAGGELSIWGEPARLVCEVRDRGRIDDPLVGRRPQQPSATGGHGLLLVNQLCDLVQLRRRVGGTTVRIQMRLR